MSALSKNRTSELVERACLIPLAGIATESCHLGPIRALSEFGQLAQSDVMSDAELLATIIHAGESQAAARDLAERLLRRFGGLRQVLHADCDALTAEYGVGRSRSAVIRALPELARRYFEASLPVGEAIRSPADTQSFLNAKIRHLGHEMFCCLYLDNRHRVLRFDELFRGTIDGTSVYPREVVKEALAINAAAVILAHNHQSRANCLFLLNAGSYSAH